MSSAQMAENTNQLYADHVDFNKYFTYPYAPRKYVVYDYNGDDVLDSKDLDTLAGYVMKTDTKTASAYDFGIKAKKALIA